MAPAAQIDIFGYVAHDIDHLLVVAKLKAVLREVAEAHSVANVEAAAVGLLLAQQQFDEGGLARTVTAYDAHLLETREVVVEVLQNDNVVETLRHILALEDLRADVDV